MTFTSILKVLALITLVGTCYNSSTKSFITAFVGIDKFQEFAVDQFNKAATIYDLSNDNLNKQLFTEEKTSFDDQDQGVIVLKTSEHSVVTTFDKNVQISMTSEGQIWTNQVTNDGIFNFAVTFKGTIGSVSPKIYDFTISLSSKKMNLQYKWGAVGDAYNLATTFNYNNNADNTLILQESASKCPTEMNDKCKKLWAQVKLYLEPIIVQSIKTALSNESTNFLPFNSAESSYLNGIIKERNLVFNTTPTNNPTFDNKKGAVFFYNGNSKLASGTYTDLTRDAADFTNFDNKQGNLQYAISRETVNNAYKLLMAGYEKTKISATEDEIDYIEEAFPQLIQNYDRDSILSLSLKVDNVEQVKFDDNKNPLTCLKGLLNIIFDDIEKTSIDILHQYCLEDVLMSGRVEKDLTTLGIYSITPKSFITSIKISSSVNIGIVNETALREWILDTLKDAFVGELFYDALQPTVPFKNLFPNDLVEDSWTSEGQFIFNTRTNTPLVSQKIQESKTAIKFLEILN